MVDFTGIAAVGSSLTRLLNQAFGAHPPVAAGPTSVVLARTEDLDLEDGPLINAPALSLFLYRVDVNTARRPSSAALGGYRGQAQLPLELHYLMIPWGDNADQEYRILGRTLQVLEDIPILSGPHLDPVTDWAPGDRIQICLADLSTEDLMRIFDSLPVDYKLCVPYVVRVMLVDGHLTAQDLDVTAASIEATPEVAT